MVGLIDTAGTALRPAGERKLIVAVMVDGFTLVAEEADGRWYNPVKLMPTGPGQPPMPMPLLQAAQDGEWMRAKPDMMLYMSSNPVPVIEMIYKRFIQQLRAARSGIQLAGAMPG